MDEILLFQIIIAFVAGGLSGYISNRVSIARLEERVRIIAKHIEESEERQR